MTEQTASNFDWDNYKDGDPLPDFVKKAGITDLGNGLAAIAVTDEDLARAKRRRAYLNEVVDRSLALVNNIRSKGSLGYEECQASLKLMVPSVFEAETIAEVFSHIICEMEFSSDE